MTLAAPSFRRLLVKQQVNSAIADLQTAWNMAVSRCQLAGVVAKNGDWFDGWEIQHDGAPQTAGCTPATGASGAGAL